MIEPFPTFFFGRTTGVPDSSTEGRTDDAGPFASDMCVTDVVGMESVGADRLREEEHWEDATEAFGSEGSIITACCLWLLYVGRDKMVLLGLSSLGGGGIGGGVRPSPLRDDDLLLFSFTTTRN